MARHGELELFEAIGDCSTSSRFPIYSATKPLVAMALLPLLEDLTRPVAELIPEFGTNGKEVVTLEQVLVHTAGFPAAPMRPEEGADPERRLARFATWRLDWEPGSQFSYHHASAHWVLAELLQRLGGADFRAVIHERVTAPLGLPRILGIPEDQQAGIVDPVIAEGGDTEIVRHLASPSSRAAGVPGGGGIATAADLVLLYQAWLRDTSGATTDLRCNLPDPILGVPVMRTPAFVLAGDDGLHQMRYAGFGKGVSPAAFGHMGAHFQLAWADPATGVSFAYLNNLVTDNVRHAGLTFPVSDSASG